MSQINKDDELKDYLEKIFSNPIEGWKLQLTRRQLLKYMGASMALAGLNACTKQPIEKIFPYSKMPEELIPGRPRYFATGLKQFGVTRGVVVESHMNRPTKIEGNPLHPESLGATDLFSQAAILDLYDPDRSQAPLHKGSFSSWADFSTDMRKEAARFHGEGGKGLYLLLEEINSPTTLRLLRKFTEDYPQAELVLNDPSANRQVLEGAELAFGRKVYPDFDLTQADVILSLESDFLFTGPGAVRHAREFSSRRRVESSSNAMNRLYVVESFPSVTGSTADHRLALKSSDIPVFLTELAAEVGIIPSSSHRYAAWVKPIAKDLQVHSGRGLVAVGAHHRPEVQALSFAINQHLGNIPRTLKFYESAESQLKKSPLNFKTLNDHIDQSQVQALIILGHNPVYSSPENLSFESSLKKIPLSIHLGEYADETAKVTTWHIPQTHDLETWSDGWATEGTASICQPLIAPLYDGKSPDEVLSVFLDSSPRTAHDLVQETWKSRFSGIDFHSRWERALHDGVIEGSSTKPVSVSLKIPADAIAKKIQPSGDSDLEINFRLDPSVGDGRGANNAWLQELPKPITKLTWENAAMVSPETADKWGLKKEDRVQLTVGNKSVTAPVLVVTGQAPGTVVVHLGYGRTAAGRIGNNLGFNANPLRSTENLWSAPVQIKKLRGSSKLATAQWDLSSEGRDLVRSSSLENFQKNPKFAQSDPVHSSILSKNPPIEPSKDYAWGMTVDLNSCIGCNACVVACQAENNIPTVGKKDVANGRIMHWIRIDQYLDTSNNAVDIKNQPLMCLHCELAPCEYVCPVGATTHSKEGLNQMVYNRCIGTRYCSNNCPYKVRHFNFRQYNDNTTETLKMQRNPDVTVRMRGVMEKCTFCVQRISEARIQSEKEGRKIKDGEIVTACQSVCPSKAIVFGNILDPKSEVSRQKESSRNYSLLAELNTFPRATYLARIKNINPEIPPHVSQWGG